MDIAIREFSADDIPEMADIWNSIVEDGIAFPQEETLGPSEALSFFSSQTYSAVAAADGLIAGLYILHPNNVGRCGHLANASYAVSRDARGRHIGEALVRDSLSEGRRLGFRVLQFNAVVKSNEAARALYRKLGFVELGTVPGGFRRKDGSGEDLLLLYHLL